MKTALCTQEIITHTHMEKISLLSVESAIVIQDQVVVHFKRSVPKCKILLTKKLMILFLSDFFFFWVIFKNNICTKIAKGGDPDLPQTPSLFQFSILNRQSILDRAIDIRVASKACALTSGLITETTTGASGHLARTLSVVVECN